MRSASIARTLQVLLGLWLFLSAFLWSHLPAVRLDDWAVGLAILCAATVAATFPRVRWGIAALAAWVLVVERLVPHVRPATRWHDGVLALLVIVAALVRDPRERAPRPAGEPVRM
jgi:hypothetical protein